MATEDAGHNNAYGLAVKYLKCVSAKLHEDLDRDHYSIVSCSAALRQASHSVGLKPKATLIWEPRVVPRCCTSSRMFTRSVRST